MGFPLLPLRSMTKIGSLFQKRAASGRPADVVLAAFAIETEKLSGLYESLALRVASLEANLPPLAQQQTKPQTESIEPMAKPDPDPLNSLAPEGQLEAGWFRILRHMLPSKVRRLLFEHDHFQQLQTEVACLRDQLVCERLKKKGVSCSGEAVVSMDAPEFPKEIFEAICRLENRDCRRRGAGSRFRRAHVRAAATGRVDFRCWF